MVIEGLCVSPSMNHNCLIFQGSFSAPLLNSANKTIAVGSQPPVITTTSKQRITFTHCCLNTSARGLCRNVFGGRSKTLKNNLDAVLKKEQHQVYKN